MTEKKIILAYEKQKFISEWEKNNYNLGYHVIHNLMKYNLDEIKTKLKRAERNTEKIKNIFESWDDLDDD